MVNEYFTSALTEAYSQRKWTKTVNVVYLTLIYTLHDYIRNSKGGSW